MLEGSGPGIRVEACRHGGVDVAIDLHALVEVILDRLGNRDKSEFDFQRFSDAIGEEAHDVVADSTGDHRFRLVCRGSGGGRDGGKHGRQHSLAHKWCFVLGIVVGIDGEISLCKSRDEFGAGRHNGADTGTQFNDADLGVFVDGHGGDVENVGETSETVGPVVIVERVKNLDLTGVSMSACRAAEFISNLAFDASGYRQRDSLAPATRPCRQQMKREMT